MDQETGKPWVLADVKMRTNVVNLIREGKPYCRVALPMCTAFSSMQNINYERRDKKVIARELECHGPH